MFRLLLPPEEISSRRGAQHFLPNLLSLNGTAVLYRTGYCSHLLPWMFIDFSLDAHSVVKGI